MWHCLWRVCSSILQWYPYISIYNARKSSTSLNVHCVFDALVPDLPAPFRIKDSGRKYKILSAVIDLALRAEKTFANMKIFSLMLVKRILLVSTLLVSISISRQLDIKAIAPRSIYKSLHDQVYSREFHSIEDLNTTRDDLIELRRRGEFLLSSVSAGDATILRQAFVDMLELVNFVAMNPNPRIFQRYFDPQYVADVNAIFATVRDMAADGGIPRPANGAKKVRPYDISEITILRGEGKLPNVAFSLNTRPQPANDDPQTITVTSFGWGALWRLLRGDLECGRDIGPKVDYKMHFLGSLLFHEVLYVTAGFCILENDV